MTLTHQYEPASGVSLAGPQLISASAPKRFRDVWMRQDMAAGMIGAGRAFRDVRLRQENRLEARRRPPTSHHVEPQRSDAADQPEPRRSVATPPLPTGDILARALIGMQKFLEAVGLPEVFKPGMGQCKSPTLLRATNSVRGPAVEIYHRGPRYRLEEALKAACEVAEAFGHKVTHRDIGHGPGQSLRACLTMG